MCADNMCTYCTHSCAGAQTTMACPKILVFDSGAGALSITEEILRKLPKCHLVCAVDNAYFPYGLKGDVELTKRIVNQVEHLHCVFSPDIVVIATRQARRYWISYARNSQTRLSELFRQLNQQQISRALDLSGFSLRPPP